MGMEIVLTREIVQALLQESARVYPFEACGLLLGEGARLTHIQPTANIAPDPARHFEIDPAALIAAHRAARQGRAQILGYYQSHPTGSPAPSATDAAMAARDGRVWAIVGGDAIGWWMDGKDGFEPLSTQLLES